MSQMKNEGTFPAKVIDHDLECDDQMNLKTVHVKFEVVDNDGECKTITAFMSMKGGAVPITMKNLVLLGFQGKADKDILTLIRSQGEGKELKPLALDGEKVVDLVLENETYEGKTRLKVKYINEQGRSAMKRSNVSAAAINLGGLNLAGHIAEARKEVGAPATTATKKAPF